MVNVLAEGYVNASGKTPSKSQKIGAVTEMSDYVLPFSRQPRRVSCFENFQV